MRPYFPKLFHFSRFFSSVTLFFVRFSVIFISFFLVLKMLLQFLYLVNLKIIGQETLLSSLRFPKWCVLSISWIVISSAISFSIMLMIPRSMSSLFFSLTPCTRRRFIFEDCSWQSKVMSISFRDVKFSFNSAMRHFRPKLVH